MKRPQVVVFDVIETLFSLEPMRPRLQSLGLPANALEVWFAQVLRDAFALTAASDYKPLEVLAAGQIEGLLAQEERTASAGELASVMAGMMELAPHPDIRPAFETLRQAGVRIFTLSNGSRLQSEKLLKSAGVFDLVEKVLSTDDIEIFKPRRETYEYAAREASSGAAASDEATIEPSQMALVAAHAWDVQGAKHAGLSAGWVVRREKRYPKAMQSPDVLGDSLPEVVQALINPA